MDYIDYCNEIKKKYNMIDGKRNIFIIGTPNHGNMGDQAIWYATQRIMEDFFKDSNVTDIDIGDFWTDIGAIAGLIQEQDIIVLPGGGNLGNIYMDDEMIRRSIVTYFPNNRLVLFPQTIYFSDDENGRTELKKSIRIYGSNKNLVLMARDTHSYKVMRDNFANDVFVLPDVVLSLNFVNEDKQRKDVLFCFRNDAEGVMDSRVISEMEEFLRQKGEKIKYTDTQIENYTKKEREHLLNNKIEEFQTASLVVTDRLHGMIFSAITGTPCIVFDNFNSKVKNAFLDLKCLDYIMMASDKEEFATDYELLKKKRGGIYDEKPVIERFVITLEEIMQLPSAKSGQKDNSIQNQIDALGSWSLKVGALQEQLKEQKDELVVYKDWVTNLQRQNDELRNALNATQDRERQWNIQQRELYNCIKFEREKNAKKRLGGRK